MEAPEVKVGNWIKIKSNDSETGIDGYVTDVYSRTVLGVGYYQNGLKTIKEDVVWKGSHWDFRYSGPNGSYITDPEAQTDCKAWSVSKFTEA